MEEFVKMFLPEDDSHAISTLVFMDLEATGLPSFVGKKNVHITEIALVAVDREDFERDESFRIVNKLSLCVRPRARISPGAMSITGLYNDVLENQEVFDESIPKLLKYFFRRLRSPVCLLAHNGKKYDFPLLQAELKRINYTLGPDVLCVDTLEALRSILNPPTNLCLNGVSEINTTENKDSTLAGVTDAKIDPFSSDKEIDKLLLKDMEIFNGIEVLNEPRVISVDIQTKNIEHCESENNKDIAFQNEHTPQSKLLGIPDEKRLKRRQKIDSDPNHSPKKQYKSNMPNSLNSDVRRKLFVHGIGSESRNHLPDSKHKILFSLPKLYNHFFGEEPPVSHYAEADCIALSKVCQKVNGEFLQWIDENSFPFNEIKEMW